MKQLISILLITFITVLVFTNCSVQKSGSISQDMAAQLALLPEDANMVGYVNFQKLKDSEFFQVFMDSTELHPFHDQEYLEFVEETGLDLEKDVQEIYMAGKFNVEKPFKYGLVIVKGNFDSEKIMDFVKRKSEDDELKMETFGDLTIYLMDEEIKAFCFYDKNTLVAGNSDILKMWIEKASDSNKSEKLNKALMARINKLKHLNSAWFTMDAKPLVEEFKKGEMEKMKGIESLKNMSVSMDLSDQFKFYGESEFKDSESAELFRDAVKGLIATGKLSMSEDRDVIDILNGINVDTADERVQIDFKFSKTEIEKLMKRRDSFDPTII